MRPKRLTVGSLFAGIGGIDYAFQEAGFDILWQIEIDDYCKQVLAKNFPKATRYSDVTTVTNLPAVDVITAGFPCQPFSVAGKRLGSEDERFLIPEMLRVIKEVSPNVVFLENVSHFATLNNGHEFRQLLKWFAQNGYNAQWQHIRAEDAGAPHRRERWFCIAYKELPDPKGNGRDKWGIYKPGLLRGNRDRHIIPTKRKRDALRYESYTVCTARHNKEMGNAESFEPKRNRTNGKQIIRPRPSQRLSKSPSYRGTGARLKIKSRLGRAINGIPHRLDKHRFPAGRNQPQHEGEAPRVTTKTENRRARIKALGNAVVPQVIYPTALMIKEYLS